MRLARMDSLEMEPREKAAEAGEECFHGSLGEEEMT